MKAVIPELLCSGGYSARETAVQLLSVAANHGKRVDAPPREMLIAVQRTSKEGGLTMP
jgi:hypothetical protein